MIGRDTGESTACDLCGVEKEDLIHFMMKCNALEGKRKKTLFGEGEDDIMKLGSLLFSRETKTVEELKVMLGGMWRERRRLRDLLGVA